MTNKQFEQSEVYKFLRSQFPEKTQLEVLEIMNHEIYWSFNQEENEILIEGHGLNHAMGWSESKGIYSLVDEDRDFDEKQQEGEE